MNGILWVVIKKIREFECFEIGEELACWAFLYFLAIGDIGEHKRAVQYV